MATVSVRLNEELVDQARAAAALNTVLSRRKLSSGQKSGALRLRTLISRVTSLPIY